MLFENMMFSMGHFTYVQLSQNILLLNISCIFKCAPNDSNCTFYFLASQSYGLVCHVLYCAALWMPLGTHMCTLTPLTIFSDTEAVLQVSDQTNEKCLHI